MICGCIAFFFCFSCFLQQWWQMSVKLKWETSKTIFKWLFIGMLGGLTLYPLVSGDRKKKSFFLCFILIIQKYKAFFLTISLWTIERPAQYSAWFLPNKGRGLHHSHYLRDDKKILRNNGGGGNKIIKNKLSTVKWNDNIKQKNCHYLLSMVICLDGNGVYSKALCDLYHS